MNKNAIETLTITGLGGAAGTVEYILGNGMYALVSPNGTGKSTAVEALRFALTGKVAPEFINADCARGAVEITLSDGGRVRRTATVTPSGGAAVRQSLNGKDASKAAVAEYLYGPDAEVAAMVTSGDFENDPDGPAGKILMSYMDASIGREDALSMILDGCADEDVKAAVMVENIPERLYMDDVKELAADYLAKRKSEKRVKKALEAARGSRPAGQAGNVEELSKVLDAAREAEAKAMAAAQILDSWKKHAAARENAMKSLDGIRREIAETEKRLGAPRKDARRSEELSKAVSDNAVRQAELKAKIQADDAEIKRLTVLIGNLRSGLCPLISTGNSPAKCMADLTPVIESVKADGNAACARKKASMAQLNALTAESAALTASLREAVAAEEDERRLAALREREKSIAASLPPEEPKPAIVDAASARQARVEAEKMLSLAIAAQDNSRVDAQLKESVLKEKVADMLVRGFAPDGPVCTALLSGYLDTLTQAAKESGDICGIHVRFTSADEGGLAAEFSPKEGGQYRRYNRLSGGEKALACIAMADILSRLSGSPVLVADNLERMDNANLARAAKLIARVSDSYGTVLLAAAEHPGTYEALNAGGITVIRPSLGLGVPATDVPDAGEESESEPDMPDSVGDTPAIEGVIPGMMEDLADGGDMKVSEFSTTVVEVGESI